MTVQAAPAIFRHKNRPHALRVAFVNNMPDGALVATERQFRHLIVAGARGRPVELAVYYLPETVRGEAGLRHCLSHYRPIVDLLRGSADLLVVTGCEPRAGSLRDEPFWASFTALVDWARAHTRSSLWSCLAAHAAVLHLDGIERRRLPAKLSGIYACRPEIDHALLAGLGDTIRVPHSRLNDLPEAGLAAAGYTVLTKSERTGVDSFLKRLPSLFIFLQGHPEYSGDSLGRELRRDFERYVLGTRPTPPALPEHYFDPDAAEAIRAGLERLRGGPSDLDSLRRLVRPALFPTADWAPGAVTFYQNWFDVVEAEALAAVERVAKSA